MITSSHELGLDHLIERPSLCAELDKAFDRRLTLIIAPAGAGKSSLLRQWTAAHPDHAFVFLDIEAADDHPAHFMRRLVEALTAVEPAMSEVSRLISVHDAGLGTPAVAALAATLEAMPDVVIIVDDAQRFSNTHLVADLGELVERTPHNVHLVVASRSDPPIALSRYRLDDELLELRQAELAFSEEEAAELLERITGHPLTSANVHALRERTEGWAAGLQLAGLNLRHEDDPDAFIADFGGSDRLVADYLGEEVLAVLPADQRELLLRMSALDDMCAGLVQAATDCTDAQSILEQLEHDSMFLVQLDTRREWFRFHHLFRDLLRSRLRVEGTIVERDILNAAADWQLAEGRAKTAVEYLLRAQSWDRALKAILANAEDVVAHGDLLTVVRWMLRIPEPVRSGRINDELLAGSLQLANDDLVASVAAPSHRSGGFQSPTGIHPTGLGFHAAQTLLGKRPEMAAAAVWRHIDERPADPLDGEPSPQSALVADGRAFLLAGELQRARELLSQSLDEAGTSTIERVSALSTMSLVEAWSGNVEHSETLICEALLTARETGHLAHPSIADAYLALVLNALERGEQRGSGVVTLAPPDPLGEVQQHASSVLFERAVSSVALGETEQARGIVSEWNGLVSEPDPLSAVQLHILLALIAADDDAPDESTRQLTEAVRVAEIYGLVDVFVRGGPSVLMRLPDVVGPQAAFRDIILARAQQSAEPRAKVELPDPLTGRELEILSYLPTRFTNDELAARCFVSVNTIKTHMVHIYRKLDATNRDAAIGRARVLGLL